MTALRIILENNVNLQKKKKIRYITVTRICGENMLNYYYAKTMYVYFHQKKK